MNIPNQSKYMQRIKIFDIRLVDIQEIKDMMTKFEVQEEFQVI